MKRLVRKASTQVLYHGTSMASLQNITEVGEIIPQGSQGAGLSSDNEYDAKHRAFNRLYDAGIVPDTPEYDEKYPSYLEEEYEKELQKLQGFTFFASGIQTAKSYAKDASNGSELIVIEASIPEDKLLPDDNDCTPCKDWQESLQEIGQVKVSGNIPSEFITGVHIFKSINDNTGQFFPGFTWKEEYQMQEVAAKRS